MQAALNYVFANSTTYTNNKKITATITLQKDVTEGSAWLVGGKATIKRTGTEGTYNYAVQVADNISKYDITIDLNKKEYIFNQYIGSENAVGVGAIKAIRTYNDSSNVGSNSLLTIKNGTISISNQKATKFERLAATYNDVTIDNVTINAAGVSAQGTGASEAIIAHDTGTLTLKNGTTFTGLKNNGKEGEEAYFAVTGRTYGDTNGTGTYAAGFTINVDTDGNVGRIGLYNRSGSDADKAVLNITNGNIEEVFYKNSPSVKSGGANGTTISGGTFEKTPTDSKVTLAEGYFFAPVGGKFAVTNTDGWYGSANAWSYVAAPATGSIGSADASLAGSNGTLTLTDVASITSGVRFDATESIFSGLTSFKTFTAENAHAAVSVTGNDYLTKITGSGQADSLVAGKTGVTLDGGADNDTLVGASAGGNTFVFNGGSDLIKGYVADDIVNLDGIDAVTSGASIKANTAGFTVGFGTGNSLTFAENVEAKVRGDGQIYTYAKDFIALNKSMTLAAETTVKALDSDNNYNAISAADANHAVSLVGNNYANTLTAGDNGSTLNGGAGNDNLTGGAGEDTFVYDDKSGKDVIYNYGTGDKFSVTSANIASGTTNSNGDLVFKIDNSNSITFKPADNGDEVEKILLAGGSDSLTKDGTIAVDGKILTLFKEQKGKVDLGESIYSGVAGINASAVGGNVVTMVGGTAGGVFTFAANKKADVFEYGGGEVSLSSYETGTDKIDLGDFALGTFSVDSAGVSLTAGTNTVAILGENIRDKEVLLHDSTSKNNSYTKMVFHETGVLYDKAKATSATLSAGVASLYSADSTIKDITIANGVTAVSVQASSKNTVIDASNAGTKDAIGISLSGGSGNDKFIGGVGKDLFIYTAGKDVITNYASGDSITAEGFDLKTAKITQSKKSVTLKFSNKNSLAIKSEDAIGTINIGGTDYNFGKNAVITGSVASLTSNFSGTYKAGSGVTTINGKSVTDKNFTMQGTSTAETLIGATGGKSANKKVTFKGGGGADSLVGGDGKDTFFYARNDTGKATVSNFSYANDNLKIKRTLTKVEKTSNGLQFQMGSADNSLTLKTDDKNNNIRSSNVLIKANNTLYWFETGSEGYGLYTAKDAESKAAIKSVLRNKSDYAIVDLNYSTNLIKGKVANVTETQFTAAMAENYKIK